MGTSLEKKNSLSQFAESLSTWLSLLGGSLLEKYWPRSNFYFFAFATNQYPAFTVKALANEDTLLRTQMFPRLPARATFVADTDFVSGTQKMFLILFWNILCRNNSFPVCAAQETSWATMCPQQCVLVCQGINSGPVQLYIQLMFVIYNLKYLLKWFY